MIRISAENEPESIVDVKLRMRQDCDEINIEMKVGDWDDWVTFLYFSTLTENGKMGAFTLPVLGAFQEVLFIRSEGRITVDGQ
jgi:hypothetical protein